MKNNIEDYNPIMFLTDQRLKKECLSLPMSHDMKIFHGSLKRALNIINEYDRDEEFLREYYCEMWWIEKDGEAGRWTLRHTYPDGHTINDITAPTLHAAIEAARGGR